MDSESTRTPRGGDVFPNLISDDAGSAISTVFEVPFTNLGTEDWKTIEGITTIIEQGDYHISYRFDQGTRQTDWVSLGNFSAGTIYKDLKIKSNEGRSLNEGYRISFRITGNVANIQTILNTLTVKGIETSKRTIHGNP